MTTTELGQPPIDIDKAATGDLTLYSVTTIIGVLEKRALMYWSAEMTANAAIDNEQTWKALLADRGRPEAVTWLRDAMDRRPKYLLESKDLGSVTHKVCEEYALKGKKPGRDFIAETIRPHTTPTTDIETEIQTVTTMLNQFDGWLQRFTPTYHAAEVAVYSPTYGYAGQLDAILEIDGVRFLTDYKTSRESYDKRGNPRMPYPDQVGLQLGGYQYAEMAAVWRPRRYEKWKRRYYVLSPDEQARAVPVPEVDTGLCIQITPEHCRAYPIQADREAYAAFLYCIEMFRWREQTSKDVMGEPLQ